MWRNTALRTPNGGNVGEAENVRGVFSVGEMSRGKCPTVRRSSSSICSRSTVTPRSRQRLSSIDLRGHRVAGRSFTVVAMTAGQINVLRQTGLRSSNWQQPDRAVASHKMGADNRRVKGTISLPLYSKISILERIVSFGNYQYIGWHWRTQRTAILRSV